MSIELLAPAQNLDVGLAAIDSGADAVYIGAPQFGARARAGNSLDDIAALVRYAHTYWARVYVTVNTLLYDDELPQAVALLHRLYDIGVDAAIIQDVGLLEGDLPPLPLIASTQMHNHTPERIAFLEAIGFRRAILARELSLAQIRAIRARTSLELEAFVHGALCVSYSGQCYMSYAVGGRSGNRGECAQPCRRHYRLVDAEGRTVVEDRHLLSLRDLNLGARLGELLDAGVTSFKIEGRLKDRAYVVNVVSWYRQQLDRLLAERGLVRSSSGHSHVDFEPDVTKTFNRGYTTYFVHGRRESPGGIDSPKMVGERVGTVHAVEGDQVTLSTDLALHSGDGLTWFDPGRELTGTLVNAVERRGNRVQVTLEDTRGLRPGVDIYRNRDQAFLRRVEQSRPVRQ
ncbi:MAG: U32 family peptidase, partial [Anaerolineae bacterium]